MCACVMFVVIVYLFIWLCVQALVSACTQVCLPMWMPEVNVRYLHLWLSVLVLETGSSTEPGAHQLSRLNGKWTQGIHLFDTPPALGWQTPAVIPSFWVVLGIWTLVLTFAWEACYWLRQDFYTGTWKQYSELGSCEALLYSGGWCFISRDWLVC